MIFAFTDFKNMCLTDQQLVKDIGTEKGISVMDFFDWINEKTHGEHYLVPTNPLPTVAPTGGGVGSACFKNIAFFSLLLFCSTV